LRKCRRRRREQRTGERQQVQPALLGPSPSKYPPS
jgi:hypothetical protein